MIQWSLTFKECKRQFRSSGAHGSSPCAPLLAVASSHSEPPIRWKKQLIRVPKGPVGLNLGHLSHLKSLWEPRITVPASFWVSL